MKLFLRGLFLVILASMLAVTSWASAKCPLFAVPRSVVSHPWFIATMFDAYFGFVTFFVWVAYKQVSWSAKISWFIAVLALGNIAMSLYCLSELFEDPKDAPLSSILVQRRAGPGILGLVLAALGVAVTVLGYATS